MTLSGHVRNGAVVLDEPTPLPEGAPVRIEVLSDADAEQSGVHRRKGGQYAGRIWMAPDFDEWPDDIAESLGMTP